MLGQDTHSKIHQLLSSIGSSTLFEPKKNLVRITSYRFSGMVKEMTPESAALFFDDLFDFLLCMLFVCKTV
jgi:hypothetical protein